MSREPIPVTTVFDGTTAYAILDGEVIAAYNAGEKRKSLRLLMQALKQMDSETHWNLCYDIQHEDL